MMSPDSEFTIKSMALEMRQVVANFLSWPDGNLYVDNNLGKKRLVRSRDLLRSAAKGEGLSNEEYLARLRKPGKDGGLYGGGPELTVLSNILRRPIAIYHLATRGELSPTTGDALEIVKVGEFGKGHFEDACSKIPDSIVANTFFFTMNNEQSVDSTARPTFSTPLKCSWDLHILIVDAGHREKHATVLLPSVPILHNAKKR